MDLIEHDLEEKKAQLRQLAIAMQELEGRSSHRSGHSQPEGTAELSAMRRRIELLQFTIRELEDTLAEHRRHRRDRERKLPLRRPDTSRRRALSDNERRTIASAYRRKILARMQLFGRELDPSQVRVTVERVTDLNGQPICDYSIVGPDND